MSCFVEVRYKCNETVVIVALRNRQELRNTIHSFFRYAACENHTQETSFQNQIDKCKRGDYILPLVECTYLRVTQQEPNAASTLYRIGFHFKMCYPVLLIIRTPAHNAPQNTLYLSVDIFSTKVLIEDIIFTSPTGDNTTFYWWSSDPRESLAACRAKGLPSFLSYSKTQSIDPAPGIEPATSRYAVKRSSCCRFIRYM